jgi:hypothetical protein
MCYVRHSVTLAFDLAGLVSEIPALAIAATGPSASTRAQNRSACLRSGNDGFGLPSCASTNAVGHGIDGRAVFTGEATNKGHVAQPCPGVLTRC